MLNNNNYLINIIICTLLFVATSSSYANDRITVSTGMDYSEGNYGTSSDTEIWYIPFTATLHKQAITYKLTLPFIQITGSGYVSGADADPSGAVGTAYTTESGVADIITSATYELVPYQANQPALDLTVKIKLPTADKNRGLGTGETDYYLQADALYGSGKLTTFATFGYKIYGDPPGVDYNNVFYLSLGESYPMSTEFNGGFIYDFRQASTAGGSVMSEVTVFTSKKLNAQKKLLIYLVKGLSAGSPDWGIGFNLIYNL